MKHKRRNDTIKYHTLRRQTQRISDKNIQIKTSLQELDEKLAPAVQHTLLGIREAVFESVSTTEDVQTPEVLPERREEDDSKMMKMMKTHAAVHDMGRSEANAFDSAYSHMEQQVEA